MDMAVRLAKLNNENELDKDVFYKDVNKGVISYPVFVKPICGSASIAISKVYDKKWL